MHIQQKLLCFDQVKSINVATWTLLG